jgi:hypothetical protein
MGIILSGTIGNKDCKEGEGMTFKMGRLNIIFEKCFNNSSKIGVEITLVIREGEMYDGLYIHVGRKGLLVTFYISPKKAKQ